MTILSFRSRTAEKTAARVSSTPDIEMVWQLHREAETRGISRVPVEIIELSDSSVPVAAIVPKGSITIFIYVQGAFEIHELRQAAVVGSPGTRFIEALQERFKARRQVSLAKAVSLATTARSVAEIRFGSKTLASNVAVLDDVGLTVLTCPFTGGNLPSEMVMLEKSHDGPKLAAIAFAHAPELTWAERCALELIPPGDVDVNIAPPSLCYAASAVTVAATVIAACSFCDRTDLHQKAVPDADVLALGPLGTATEIIKSIRESIDGA